MFRNRSPPAKDFTAIKFTDLLIITPISTSLFHLAQIIFNKLVKHVSNIASLNLMTFLVAVRPCFSKMLHKVLYSSGILKVVHKFKSFHSPLIRSACRQDSEQDDKLPTCTSLPCESFKQVSAMSISFSLFTDPHGRHHSFWWSQKFTIFRFIFRYSLPFRRARFFHIYLSLFGPELSSYSVEQS